MRKDLKVPVANLTTRQAAALEYVANYMLKHGYPPTIREIGDDMEIKSTNGVNDHLKAIERKGYIVREGAKSRAIRPLFMPDKRPFEEWLMESQGLSYYNTGAEEDLISIPLVGKIAAGTPISAIENREDTLIMGTSMFGKKGKKDIFALRVSGNSMIEDGIFDGDTIFVRKVDDAPDGTIVAVLIENEATVKRIYHEPDGRIRLQPANSAMSPVYITEEQARYSAIRGVVVALFRHL